MFKEKSILLISPEGWDHNFVSKHHYASKLAAQGNKIYFLNPPSNERDMLQVNDNLFVINYTSIFKGLNRMPIWLSAYLTKLEIFSIQKKASIKVDLIWNFDSSRFTNLKRIKNIYKIYHIVDLTEKMDRGMGSRTADICFGTTRFIVNGLKAGNKHSYKIHHGFHNLISHDSIKLPVTKNKIKTGYVGNLNIKYLDWEIIYNLINDNVGIDFYFVGSFVLTQEIRMTYNLPNTYFLGKQSSSYCTSFVKQMDINLVIYKSKKYKKQLASPHKIMEYLSSGNAIVATYTDEYERKKDLLEMESAQETVLQVFDRVVKNLDYYNSPEKRKKRINFVNGNTYLKQIERIEKHIEESSKD